MQGLETVKRIFFPSFLRETEIFPPSSQYFMALSSKIAGSFKIDSRSPVKVISGATSALKVLPRTFAREEKAVFLVDSTLYDTFSKGLYDMVEPEKIPEVGDFTKLTVKGPESDFTLSYLEENEGISYSDEYHFFVLDKENKIQAADTPSSESLCRRVSGISLSNCVAYFATPEELSEYGLSEDKATVVTLYYKGKDRDSGKEEHFTLRLGKNTDKGCYVALEGSNMVYLTEKDRADTLRYANYSMLYPKDICLLDWDTVENMRITTAEKSSEIRFEKGENGERKYTDQNKKELNREGVNSLLDAISQMRADDDVVNPQKVSEQISFTFYRSTKDYREMKLSFYYYDDTYYLAELNGGKSNLVEKSKVDDLISIAKSVAEEK